MALEDAEAVNRAIHADLIRRADALATFYNESKSKYTYFLMAAAGASIGYALQKLDSLPRTALNSMAVVAIILWAISILLGCLSITRIHRILSANHAQIELTAASLVNPIVAGLREIKRPNLTERTRANAEVAKWFSRLQFWSLIGGVWVYAIWKIIAWWWHVPPSPAEQVLGNWGC
ncbi:hypothetical protein [Dyella sp. GSA-30]|uniref:hypothetical protein n=1 Tax=Dyella sp. GSA-30 TaxID=2994496 RepID=UPI002490C82E|nr:hypothetical protein [Dyella sp. GSA-30]BDU21185.1 hypothetical protein DYGSA30_26420 [Dyella sp. GSA-30]